MVEVGTELRKPACPRSNSVKLYRHGRAKKRGVLHGWSHRKKVYADIARHRWGCRGCGYCFTEGVGLLHPHPRLTKQAEAEALRQLKYLCLSQVKKELVISYSTMRRLLERQIDGDVLGIIKEEEGLFLGIDEPISRHQDMMYTVILNQRVMEN